MESDREHAVSLLVEGQNLFEARNPDAAAMLLQEAVRRFQLLGDREGEMASRMLLGTVMAVAGRAEEAVPIARRALLLAGELGDRSVEISVAGSLAGILVAAGETLEALRLLEAQRETVQRLGDPEQERLVLNGLGQLYVRLGRLEEAREAFTRCLGLARGLGDPAAEAESLMGIGFCLLRQGHYLESLRCFENAAHLARAQGDLIFEAQALSRLGSLHHYLGDFGRSIENHQRALEILRRLGRHGEQAGVLSEMSRAYLAAGEPEQAKRCNEEALRIARQIGDLVVQSSSLAHLAHIALLEGDHRLAIRNWQESLAIKEKTGDVFGIAASMGSMSIAYLALGSRDEAVALAERALALVQSLGAPEEIGMAWMTVGLVRLRGGDLSGAESALRQSIEHLEALRAPLTEDHWQVSLSDRQHIPYRLLQETLVARGEAGLALEVAERGRAQALARLMARNLPSPDSHEPARLADLQRIAREQGATILEYTLLVDPVSLVLGQGLEGAHALLVWVVQPDGEVAARRVDLLVETTSSRSIQEIPLQQQLRDMSDPETYQPGAWHEGYRQLIEPVESLLPKEPGARLVIVPQDLFVLIPWAALEDGDGRPLVERYALSLSPSIETLDLAARRKAEIAQDRGPGLVVGDPEFGEGSGLRRLPGTAKEAHVVAGLLGTRPLLGREATKPEVLRRMEGQRILHFATHGLLEEIQGLDIPGAIALTPAGPEDDGLLSAAEILGLDLTADLAVLSACRSGQGRASSDSMIGLSRSFLIAGVPSLLVALWPIPDHSTALLMTEFYRAMMAGLGKAQALRQAMLTTRSLYPDPQVWAGFALLGDAS